MLIEAKPVKRVTASESTVLSKLEALGAYRYRSRAWLDYDMCCHYNDGGHS